MERLVAALVLVFVSLLVLFATWQFYAGNLAGGISVLPFLVITYLFVINRRRG